MRSSTIYFISDSEKTIRLYRTELLEQLRIKHDVNLVFIGQWIKLIRLCFQRNTFVISSNLRANLLTLLFPFTRKVVILNGLGRFKTSRLFRRFLIILLNSQKNISLVCQNYQDYRYFRRASKVSITFIMGSGGVSFNRREGGEKFVQDEPSIVVSRDSKIDLQIDCIREYLRLDSRKLLVIGLADTSLVSIVGASACGWLNREQIFSSYRRIFHPSGYGEGFPHVLADAFCNGFEVTISKRDYINYGLYKCALEYTRLGDFFVINSFNCDYSWLAVEIVNREYLDVITNAFGEGITDAV